MTIIAALLQLKQCFAKQEGEILTIVLDKKAYDFLDKECTRVCSHCCLGVCPTCGRVTDNKIMGIDIFKKKVGPGFLSEEELKKENYRNPVI